MQGTSVGSICYSDNSEEVKGRYGLPLELGTEVLRQTPLALQAMLSDLCADWIARRSQRWSGTGKTTWRRAPIPSSVR